MAGANAIPDLLGSHCRHGTELVAELGYDRRASWSDEFVCLFALPERDAAQDLQRRRGRDREPSVLALEPPAALFESGDVDPLNSQRLNSDANADDVRNRIKGTNLVKMDVLRGGAMNFGLGDGYAGKDRQRVFLHKRRKGAGFNQFLDVLVGTLRSMGVLVAVTM